MLHRTSWLLAALIACGACKSQSAPAAAPVRHVPDCRAGHMTILADVMTCRMAPFQKGQISEAEFRDTLARLAEVAPDPAWTNGESGWPQIVDRMLQTRLYGQGCKECHKTYIDRYRKGYHDRPIGPF